MNDRRLCRVGVLFGGRSSEHEVSLASARNVMDALQQAGHAVIPIGITRRGRWLPRQDAHGQLVAQSQSDSETPDRATGEGWALLPHDEPNEPLPEIDVVFPVLHGPFGEDGTVQGLLEMASLPYVGSGVLGSAVAMDKAVARLLFAAAGLPQVRYVVIKRNAWRSDAKGTTHTVEAQLTYPMFVKPANMGSSVGVHKVRSRHELVEGLDAAARFDRKLLVEEAVPNVREIEVSVLGNETPIASVPGEIVPGNEFYDYEAKYLDDNSDLIIPAQLDGAVADTVRDLAVQAFQVLGCEGLARVDFLVDGETGAVYVNEVNTMPGFTRISMYPKLWEASGMGYPALVDRLVQLALERFCDRQEISTAR